MAQPPPDFVAHDGNTYQWPPPTGWWQAQDGRWYPPQDTMAPPQQWAAPESASRPFWKKKRFLIPLGVLLLLIVGGAVAGNPDDSDDDQGVAAGEAVDNDQGDNDDSMASTEQETTTTTAVELAESDDFISCTPIDGESYTLEMVNQSPKTSSYLMTVVLLDDAGARVDDVPEFVNNLRPGERLIEDRIVFSDSGYATCELLELERFASESDAGEMAEVVCEVTGSDVFGDVDGVVTATNGTPKDSDYSISMAIVDADGIRRGETVAFIERVRPGETAPQDLFTGVDHAAGYGCEVVGVERTASN